MARGSQRKGRRGELEDIRSFLQDRHHTWDLRYDQEAQSRGVDYVLFVPPIHFLVQRKIVGAKRLGTIIAATNQIAKSVDWGDDAVPILHITLQAWRNPLDARKPLDLAVMAWGDFVDTVAKFKSR